LRLALYTDSVSELPLEGALDFARELEIDAVEIATGGQSPAPHLRIEELLRDGTALERFRNAFEARGVELTALNCSAWPLHPIHDAAHRRLIRDTIELAGRLGIRTIVSMSGCGGDSAEATTINWVWYPWPPDAVALLERQWEAVIPMWQELAAHAERHGVERVALELHPLHLAYNVPTLLRLREAVGPVIGANVDPSHMFWQQMDPIACVEALGDAVHHVHLKDSEVVRAQAALTGVLDSRPFAEPKKRAWVFRTVGRAHDASFWRPFFDALARVGYDGSLSIENEDVEQPQQAGVREAASFARRLLEAAEQVPA
jgi:sugar phosphate isomerase/epimerase